MLRFADLFILFAVTDSSVKKVRFGFCRTNALLKVVFAATLSCFLLSRGCRYMCHIDSRMRPAADKTIKRGLHCFNMRCFLGWSSR
uniref:Secreted protein n=1 Tax=Parascaris equorum TaxID=6256 RepID=A0A914R786_PAREQ